MAHDGLKNGFPTITGEFLEGVRAAAALGHKQCTGRGPQRVAVALDGYVLTITLEGFLTPLEKVILRDRSNFEAVLGLRNSVLRNSIPEMNASFFQMGLRVIGCDGNLDCERDRRVIRIELEKF